MRLKTQGNIAGRFSINITMFLNKEVFLNTFCFLVASSHKRKRFHHFLMKLNSFIKCRLINALYSIVNISFFEMKETC